MFELKRSQQQAPDNIVPFEDRTPPNSPEAEEHVLGCLLLQGDLFEEVSSAGLTPEAFYVGQHRKIYQAMRILAAAQRPVDLTQVAIQLSTSGDLEAVGGNSALLQLQEPIFSAANVLSAVDVVIDAHRRREGLERLRSIMASIRDRGQPLKTVLESAEKTIYGLSHDGAADHQKAEWLYELCPVQYALLESDDLQAYMTGLIDLDGLTGGLRPGTLTVAAGRPSMGKSHLGAALAWAIASTYQQPVVFISCEMDKGAVWRRLLAHVSHVDSARIRSKQLTPDDWSKVMAAQDVLSKVPILVYHVPNPSGVEIRRIVRRAHQQHGEKPALIVLDYLQLLGGDADSNRTTEIDRLARDCRAIASEMELAFFALAQINRGVESRDDKRPRMSDIRESGAIENHADQVWLMYRDEYYKPETCDRGIIEINVGKNRDALTGMAKLLFLPQYSIFRNLKR